MAFTRGIYAVAKTKSYEYVFSDHVWASFNYNFGRSKIAKQDVPIFRSLD